MLSKLTKKGMLLYFLMVAVLMAASTFLNQSPVCYADTIQENEPNDNRNVANVIQTNTDICGTITAGDTDMYKFVVPDRGYFNISFYQDYVDERDYGYRIVLYDEGLHVIEQYSRQNRLDSQNFPFQKDSCFYIGINGEFSSTDYSKYGGYCLKVNFTKDDTWEVENNEDKNTATSLKTGAKMMADIHNENDVDYFMYKAVQSGYVTFDFYNEDAITDTNGWDLYVYDSALNQLSEKSITTDTTIGTFVLSKGQVLYVRLNRDDSDVVGCKYSITPKFVAQKYTESESNDDIRHADPIKMNKTYYGARNRENDVDCYVFKATKTKKIKISISYDEKLTYSDSISVYDAKNNKSVSETVDLSGSIKLKAEKGKKYYITVGRNSAWAYNWNSLYKLKVK